MTTVDQALRVERDEFYKELDRLLRLLAAQQHLAASRGGSSALGFQRSETGEAQAVWAARQRAVAELGERRAHSGREIYGNANFRRRTTIRGGKPEAPHSDVRR
jgi:hypothetical protein